MYVKLARPDGFDFHTGNTINYRDNIGKTVKPPKANPKGRLCSSAFIHASVKPNDCFIGAKIPCSAYRVEGTPVITEFQKCGFVELKVLEEITNLDKLFGWNYTEVCSPIHPFKMPKKRKATPERLELLRLWGSVRDSVRGSVRDSVWGSVRDSVRDSVGDSVWDSVWDSVGGSVWGSVWDSVRDSVWAYIGNLFPNVEKWSGIKQEPGVYPFQSAVDLWKQGIVPACDGKLWYLLSGKNADIIWKGTM